MTPALPSEPAIPSAVPKEQPAPEISEAIYRLLVEQANEGIYVVQDGRIVFANASFSRIAGRIAIDPLGLSMEEFLFPDDRARVWEHHRRLSAGEQLGDPFEIQIPVPRGGTRWVSISSVPFAWNGQPATLNYATTITERKQAEATLREQLEELNRWHHAMLGRESRNLELKREVNDLLALAGLPERYASVTAEEERKK